jgi:hypothetical protein
MARYRLVLFGGNASTAAMGDAVAATVSAQVSADR